MFGASLVPFIQAALLLFTFVVFCFYTEINAIKTFRVFFFLSSAHTLSLSFPLSVGTAPYHINVSQPLFFNGIVLVF